jgi:hypothetical protein
MARGMPDVMNDDLVIANFIEHQIRMRRNDQSADGWIVGACANQGMQWQEIDEGFDAVLNPRCALR